MNRRDFMQMIPAAAALGLVGCATTSQPARDTRCFELRIYHAPDGRLNDLHARFRDHTVALFAKHGMQNIGYWTPVENPDNKLVYLLAYPSRQARDASWKAFAADPQWQAVRQKTEADGKIVSLAESQFLETTDYSPALQTGPAPRQGVFVLRTYSTPPSLLPHLDARFRDHTRRLFARHGLKNWAYFHLATGQPAADTTLIYFLRHKSQEAAIASFEQFRQDPEWQIVKEYSERKLGSLTLPDGVKTEFLVPTDYSPTR